MCPGQSRENPPQIRTAGGSRKHLTMHGNWTPYFRREASPVVAKLLKKWDASSRYSGSKPFSFYQLEYHLEREYGLMARGKSKGNGTTTKPVSAAAKNTVWHNYKISSEDAVLIREDAQDVVSLCSRLAGLFALGADVTVRYVPDRGNYSAFAVSAARDDSPDRIGLSAFGGTVWEAIAAMLFKFDLLQSRPEALTAGGAGLGIG
jgi:hypothetical protein